MNGDKRIVIWSDLNNDFSTDERGDLKISTNADAVGESIENILMTRVGERVMRPDFGSFLQRFLFEPLHEDTAYKIAVEVSRALQQEDRFVAEQIEVAVDRSLQGYRIRIGGVIKGLNIPKEFIRILVWE